MSAWVTSSHCSLRCTSILPLSLKNRCLPCLLTPPVKGTMRTRTEIKAHGAREEKMDRTTAAPNPYWDSTNVDAQDMIKDVKFNEAGIVAAIAQQHDTGEVLMMAWMNAESIRETVRTGRVVYYSRSRQKLWRKGETSGQIQYLRDVLLDCDGDTLLIKVEQLGVACHTGRRSCFYTAYRPPLGKPQIIADVLMDPNEMYGKKEK